jgi:hypothetical protein
VGETNHLPISAEQWFADWPDRETLLNEIIARGVALAQSGVKKPKGWHEHHVVPRWIGNGEGPVAWLTRSDHRLVHQIRYELYGDVRDKRAADHLNSKYTDEELLEIAAEMGRRTGPANVQIMHEKATREQHSEGGKIGGKIAVETGQLRSVSTADVCRRGAAATNDIRMHCTTHGLTCAPGPMGRHRRKHGGTCVIVRLPDE